MIYLAYARAGKEFEVAAAINALSVDCWCGKRMDFIRRGRKRRPEPVISPYLPNYLFADVPAERFLDVMAVKWLANTLTPLSEADTVSLRAFREGVEAEYAAAEKASQNRDAICQFKHGQKLKIIDGPLMDSMVTFRRMVEAAHDAYPRVMVEADVMGRTVEVSVDPLSVKEN